jgi:hypothetical protein
MTAHISSLRGDRDIAFAACARLDKLRDDVQAAMDAVASKFYCAVLESPDIAKLDYSGFNTQLTEAVDALFQELIWDAESALALADIALNEAEMDALLSGS